MLDLQKSTKDAIQMLKTLQHQTHSLPSIQIYKGKEGIQTMIGAITKKPCHVSILSDEIHFYDLIDNDLINLKQASMQQK